MTLGDVTQEPEYIKKVKKEQWRTYRVNFPDKKEVIQEVKDTIGFFKIPERVGAVESRSLKYGIISKIFRLSDGWKVTLSGLENKYYTSLERKLKGIKDKFFI